MDPKEGESFFDVTKEANKDLLALIAPHRTNKKVQEILRVKNVRRRRVAQTRPEKVVALIQKCGRILKLLLRVLNKVSHIAAHLLYELSLHTIRLVQQAFRVGRNIYRQLQSTDSDDLSFLTRLYPALFSSKRFGGFRFNQPSPFIATLLIISIIGSSLLTPLRSQAASFTTTWTTQGDFESNTAGGIATSTIRSLADTTTSAGDVKMGPGAAQTVSTSFADSGLLDRWTFDAKDMNFSTGVVTDQVGTHNGTWSGSYSATTNMAQGQDAEAANFTGTGSNLVGLGASTRIIPITGAYTVSAWVRTNIVNTTQQILLSNAATCCGAEASLAIEFNSGASKYWFRLTHGSGGLNMNSATLISANTWYHVVATFDGSSVAKIYVNGALDATASASAPPNFSGNSPTSLIGGDGGSANLKGQLDDLRVYNRALSASEVSELYNTKSFTVTDVDYANTTARSDNGKAANQSVVLAATSTSNNGGSGVTGSSFSYTTPSGNNRLLVVGVPRSNMTGNVTSVTYNSQSLTKLAESMGSFTGVDFWYLLNPPTGAHTIAITSGSTELQAYLAQSYNNVNQSTPVGTAVTGSKTDNPALDLVVTSATNELVNTIVSGGAATYTTSQYLTASKTNSSLLGQATALPGAASVTSSWLPNSFSMAAVAVPIKAGSSVVQSGVVATVSGGIAYATLTGTHSVGNGSITYELSNDGGSTWISATSGSLATFSSAAGTQLKWRATLTGSATITSVSITYNGYSTTTISNLKKDTNADSQWVSVSWNATLPSNTLIKFRTRGTTEAQGLNALYSASWSDYYVDSVTGAGSATIKANGAGGANNPVYRYMEVEVTLISSDGTSMPTLNDFSLTYAQNGPPDFNPDYPTTNAGGIATSQVTSPSDDNWGRVQIAYSVHDADTTSGTSNPGYVTPTYFYRLDGSSSWISIGSSYLTSGATSNKAVQEGSYTNYTVYWDAKSQIPANYSSIAQIKVTVNDNEIISNTASTSTANMILDTTNPSASIHITGNSSTSTITAVLSDNSTIKDYEVSNNGDFSADGSNASSGSWQSLNQTSATIYIPWTLPSATSSKTVYFRTRDIYNNIATSTLVAPPTPSTIEIHDLSNPNGASFREFITWGAYTSVSGATFSRYEVYRATDGATYSLLTTLNSSDVNYYLDTSLGSTTSYSYKIRTVDSDGDTSGYTSVVTDTPDGQGGTDTVAPNLSNVVIDTIRNTSARVTWTSDELSNSTVEYGLTPLLGGTATSSTYTTSHTVTLTSLLPNTTYYLRVKSTDIAGNIGSNDNGGANYSFTTVGGPVISNVTVNELTDKSATIFWNTSTSSDSFVYYSTNSNLSSPVQVGSSSFVTSSSTTFQHRVTLTGLTSGVTYYFYVTSRDPDGNDATADNNGSYYSFVTTTDTKAPVISNISVPVASPTQLVIFWITDEPATSQLEYGTTASTSDGSYAHSTDIDSTLSLSHAVAISGLTAETTYYFRAKSTDAAGNTAVSDEVATSTVRTGDVVIINAGGGAVAPSRNYTPPTITKISVDPIHPFDATVNVEGSPQFFSFVQYGETTAYDNSAGDASLTTSKKIKIKGLKPGTLYHYKVKAIDENGNITESSDKTFTTTFGAEALANLTLLQKAADYQDQLEAFIESALPSVLPPFISKPEVVDITEQSATVRWNTNISSYSVLDYAKDSEYVAGKDYPNELTDLRATTTVHAMDLVNLEPNTKYHVSARSFVFPQVIGKSPDITFVTKAGNIKAQVIDVGNDTFRVVWSTDVETSSIVEYINTATGISNKQSDEKLTTRHDVQIKNLTPGATYSIRAYGVTKDGNPVEMKGKLTITLSRDTTAPQVSSLKIDSALVPGRTDRIQSVVTWKTDEPSTSVVAYEEGSGAADAELKNKVEDKIGIVTDHVVILPNLKPGTIYRIQVSSVDSAGNVLVLPVRTIVTPRQNESIVDVIFKNFSDTFQFINNVR